MRGRRLQALILLAGAAVGVIAEWGGIGGTEPASWVPDLAAGWWMIACGLVASARGTGSRVGVLITASGFLWFAGNFTDSRVGFVAAMSAQVIYLYRGPLLQALLAFPSGRPRGVWGWSSVAVAYATAAVPGIWQSWLATVAVGGALCLAGVHHSYARSGAIDRSTRRVTLQAGAWLAALLIGTSFARAFDPSGSVSQVTLLAYEVGLCLLVSALSWWLARASIRTLPTTDLVVELTSVRSGTVREALSVALNDPTLDVGYSIAGTAGYIDEFGLPFPIASADGRVITTVDSDQRRGRCSSMIPPCSVTRC